MSKLKIGTRGSDLALFQTRSVINELGKKNIFATEEITQTRGDVDQRPFANISGDGFFTKELEQNILNGKVDLAVHSCKDLPSLCHDSLPWMAFGSRENTVDVLVQKTNVKLNPGSRIGTSSPRRKAQLKALGYKNIVELRGNVPTRANKVLSGDMDAIVLAKAGVNRLGLIPKLEAQGLQFADLNFVTAPCQGVVALQMHKKHLLTLEGSCNSELDQIAKAEKSVLALLGGGCHLPLGAKISKNENKYVLDYFLEESNGRSSDLRVEANGISELLRLLVQKLSGAVPSEKKIIITSPLQHLLKPSRLVAQLGFCPLPMPLTEVVPSWSIDSLIDAGQKIESFDAIAFASQFAVQIFIHEMASRCDVIGILNKTKVFAIGKSTAKTLSDYGIENVTVAEDATGEKLALALSGVRGEILLPCAVESNAQKLITKTGAKVLPLHLYTTRQCKNPMNSMDFSITKNEKIVITSPSAARLWSQRLIIRPELKNVDLWAFGPTTAKELNASGLKCKHNPESGSWNALLAAIAKDS